MAVLSALASSLLLVPLSFRPLQMSMQFGSKSSPLLLLLSFRPLQMVMRIWIQAVVAVFVLCVHLAAVFAASCLDRGRCRRFRRLRVACRCIVVAVFVVCVSFAV